MSTNDDRGGAMHDPDAEVRKEAARALGKARTERKIAAARAVAASRRGKPLSEEHKAKIRAAQERRWELVRQAAGNEETTPGEKKPVGRPRTRPVASENTPKRPVGRPRKQQEEANS